jgi:Mrp family chromosome partitioning ATPase
LNLRDYLDVVWRRRWLVLLVALIGGAAVWLVGRPPEPTAATYSASATLTLTERERDNPGAILLYAYVVNETSEITEQVAGDLGEDVYADDRTTQEVIEERLTIEAVPEIGTLTMTIVGQPSQEVASRVLELHSQYIVEYAMARRAEERDESLQALESQQQILEAEATRLDEELESLAEQTLTEEQRQSGVSVDRVMEAQLATALSSLSQVTAEADDLRSLTDEELSPVRLVGLPAVTAEPVPSDPLGFAGRLAVGEAVALLLGIGLAITLHRFDTRIFNRRDAEAAFQLPVLAEIPKIPWRIRRKTTLIARTRPDAPASEAYRILRSSLALARSRQLEEHDNRRPGHAGTVILVGSASADVGKSSTVANLAIACVDAGNTVLAISADLRQPTLHRLFAVSPGIGLTEAIDDLQLRNDEVDLTDYLTPTGHEGIALLLNGHAVPNPGERLAAARTLIAAAKERYDIILIDTPPMLVGNDVNELLPFVDLVLLVARTGRTTIDEGRWIDEVATRLDVPTCGVALIGARSDLERHGALRRRTPLLRFGRRQKKAEVPNQPLRPQVATAAGREAPRPQPATDHHPADAQSRWTPPPAAQRPQPAAPPRQPAAQPSLAGWTTEPPDQHHPPSAPTGQHPIVRPTPSWNQPQESQAPPAAADTTQAPDNPQLEVNWANATAELPAIGWDPARQAKMGDAAASDARRQPGAPRPQHREGGQAEDGSPTPDISDILFAGGAAQAGPASSNAGGPAIRPSPGDDSTGANGTTSSEGNGSMAAPAGTNGHSEEPDGEKVDAAAAAQVDLPNRPTND